MKSKKRERGKLTVKLFHRVILGIINQSEPFSCAVVVRCHSTVFITSDYQVRIDDSLEARPGIDFQAKMTTLKKWDFECVLLSFSKVIIRAFRR